MKHGPLAEADAFLRATFNGALLGADAYSTIKLLLVLLGVSRVLKDLRRASRCEGLYSWLMRYIAKWLKRLPFVQSQLKKETDKLRHDIQPSLIKDLTQPKTRLPAAGMAEDKVLKLMLERRELDTKYWQDGRVTGAIYHGKREYMDFVGKVSGLFAFTNPLHASIHPATRQMESEVISMVLRMYSGPATACGAFTTGGTESILMAMKAYRDKGRAERGITEPNIVVCVTAHAAFDKAAQYFNLECRKARTTGPQEVDLVHVRSLIDANTVAIVGSACQYAHGTIDNIPKLSELALSYGVGLHVDCCLGGFLVPFMRAADFELRHEYDFRVPGVTTISCDPHKYGFAPKGSSVLMFRTPELRHYMYTFVTEWTGGIYATPSILGSRPAHSQDRGSHRGHRRSRTHGPTGCMRGRMAREARQRHQLLLALRRAQGDPRMGSRHAPTARLGPFGTHIAHERERGLVHCGLEGGCGQGACGPGQVLGRHGWPVRHRLQDARLLCRGVGQGLPGRDDIGRRGGECPWRGCVSKS